MEFERCTCEKSLATPLTRTGTLPSALFNFMIVLSCPFSLDSIRKLANRSWSTNFFLKMTTIRVGQRALNREKKGMA